MTAFIELFTLLRDGMQSMLLSLLGSLNSTTIQLVADIIFWFVWLWLIYHILAKPFIKLLGCVLSIIRNPFFDELEEGE